MNDGKESDWGLQQTAPTEEPRLAFSGDTSWMDVRVEADVKVVKWGVALPSQHEMALIGVTTVDGKDEQIGVARYTTNLDKTSCEFALTVSDDWQHRGIGHILMKDLMDVARDRDLSEMEGQVLSSNSKMLDLVQTLGFRVGNDPDDPSIKQVVARL